MTSPSPADRTAEIRVRLENTAYFTPPWRSEYDPFGTDINFGAHHQITDADGDLVCVTDAGDAMEAFLRQAPTNIEYLLEENDRLSARVGELEEQLAKVEGWSLRTVGGEVVLSRAHYTDSRELTGFDLPVGAVLAFIADAAGEVSTDDQ